MHQKLPLVIVLVASIAIVGFVDSCSPDYKMFQLAHYDRPCTQCQRIHVTKTCTSLYHNSTFECATPVVDYSITLGQSPCARAMVTCSSLQFGEPQSIVIVGRLGGSNSTTPIDLSEEYGTISSLQSPNAHILLKCDSESQWLMEDLDGNVLEQPLVLQCAHTHHDTVFETLNQ